MLQGALDFSGLGLYSIGLHEEDRGAMFVEASVQLVFDISSRLDFGSPETSEPQVHIDPLSTLYGVLGFRV